MEQKNNEFLLAFRFDENICKKYNLHLYDFLYNKIFGDIMPYNLTKSEDKLLENSMPQKPIK